MKKVIIIGAGISGLTAGIFSRELGLETDIYEMNTIPGGECTGWSRKGYHFDNCIHWLTGTNKESDLYKVWEKIGALRDDIDIINHDYFLAVNIDGQTVYLYKDINKLKDHLLHVSKEDKQTIDEFINILESAKSCNVPTKKPIDKMNIGDFLEVMKSYKAYGKYHEELSKISIGDYVSRFKSKAIQKALLSCVPSDYSATAFFFTLGTFVAGNGGVPKGGSLEMSLRIEKKYKNLGGRIHYNSDVDGIMIEDSIAKGISLKSGEKVYGDFVISAVDAHVLLKGLLKNKYVDKLFDSRYENSGDYPIKSSVDIFIGVKCDLSKYNHMEVFNVTPFKIGTDSIDSLSFKHYCYDDKFAPLGSSVIKTSIMSKDYDYWKKLKILSPKRYSLEKENLAKEIIKIVEALYPETKNNIEVYDVVTPVTYERYCGAYRGAWMAFEMTPNSKNTQHKGIIQGINNLYVAGQWVMMPGGLPAACLAGKWAIQRLCKDEKIKFTFEY